MFGHPKPRGRQGKERQGKGGKGSQGKARQGKRGVGAHSVIVLCFCCASVDFTHQEKRKNKARQLMSDVCRIPTSTGMLRERTSQRLYNWKPIFGTKHLGNSIGKGFGTLTE